MSKFRKCSKGIRTLQPRTNALGGAEREDGSSPKRDLVLYIEDERINWEISELALRRRFRLRWAKNDREACELLARYHSDLLAILMDIELKGSLLDGTQLTRLIRGRLPTDELPAYAHDVPTLQVPIFFVTAYGARYSEQELLRLGGDRLISKPVNFGELSLALTSLRANDSDSTTQALLQAARAPDVSVNTISARLNLDPATIHRMSNLFRVGAFEADPGLSLDRAVVSRGVEGVRNLALSLAALDLLDDRGEDATTILACALRRGAAARLLATYFAPSIKEQALVTGLLIEAGLLARARHDLPGTMEVIRCPSNTRTVRERATGEVEHPSRGGQIVRAWCVETTMCTAVETHHDEPFPGVEPLINIARIAERIAAVFEAGDIETNVKSAHEAAEKIGLSLEIADTIIEQLPQATRQLAQGFGIEIAEQPTLQALRSKVGDRLTVMAQAYAELVHNLESVVSEKDVALSRAVQAQSSLKKRATELKELNAQLEEEIRKREQMQAQLIFADKMASLGTLAAGVAHEINNPLSYVLINLDFLREAFEQHMGGLPESERMLLNAALQDVQQGAERIRSVVHDLRPLASSEDETPTDVNLQDAIELSIRMASNELRHRVRLMQSYSDIPHVWGTASRLGQVFLNILINAAHAIADGAADRNEIRIDVRKPSEDWVVVEISDTGAGMRAEVLRRIFDPFFTTKPMGVGTGLGLSICNNIVRAFGGKMDAESEPGKGTRVRVWLVPATDAIPSPRRVTQPPVVAQRTETTSTPAYETDNQAEEAPAKTRILIVDDEVRVSKVLGRILREHDVEFVHNGRDAIERCKHGAFDVIFCDLMMPEVSGIDVFAQLQSDDPRQADRMVFMTGGAFTERAREFVTTVPDRILEKPFDPDEVHAYVAAVTAKLAQSADLPMQPSTAPTSSTIGTDVPPANDEPSPLLS